MFRLPVCFLAVCALAALGRADDKKADATFDDATATLTQTVDGKEKTTKIDLKYCLKVKGRFTDKGFVIDVVDPDGPAAMLDLNGQVAMMEKGDIIVEVDGKKVKSAEDYAKALNGAKDASKIPIKVKDVNTGQDADFTVAAAKR
jgi:S1-C subfamily serine protease